jgi:hypothetical protein
MMSAKLIESLDLATKRFVDSGPVAALLLHCTLAAIRHEPAAQGLYFELRGAEWIMTLIQHADQSVRLAALELLAGCVGNHEANRLIAVGAGFPAVLQDMSTADPSPEIRIKCAEVRLAIALESHLLASQ